MDNEDTMNLCDDDFMSGNDETNEDENMQSDSRASTAENKKGTLKRRTSKCWRYFTVVGEKKRDGKSDIQCNYCLNHFSVDIKRSRTTPLLRHMKSCSKTPGSTPGTTRKIDMAVFREMIAGAIIEHDLPYSFVEYRRIREAFAYANSTIEFWSRNTAASDCMKIFVKEKKKLKKMLSEIPGRFCLTTDLWEEYSDILAIAAVFDPRLKFTFLEYCFTTLDATTSKSKLDHVRKKMEKLFEAYRKDPKKTETSQASSSAITLPGYDGFYAFFSQTASSSGKSVLDKYLDEPVLDMVAFRSLNVLSYWKDNANRFKELSNMACDVLSIPITTVASESSFSIGSLVLNKYRSCLLPTNVQALICSRNWLRGFQEIGDEFESIEENKEGEEGEKE